MNNANEPWESPALMPMLAYDDPEAAIKWYEDAFGAIDTGRLLGGDGKIVFSSVSIGRAAIAISPVFEGYSTTPESLGGCSVVLNLNVPDVDAFCARAIAAGAKELLPIADQFYGDRSGRIEDPFGHIWIIATTTEKLSIADMQQRLNQMSQHS